MNSFELNKIAMAFLLTILVVFLISGLTEMIYDHEELETNAYPIEVQVAEAVSEDAEPVEQGPSLAELLMVASVEKGEKTFKKCKSCHTVDKGGKNLVGPNLWDIVGRDKGVHEGFSYSDSMLEMDGNWTYEDLDMFLKSPKGFVTGTKMSFAGLKKPSDRADVIAYLRTLSDAPRDLPAVEAEAAGEVDAEGGEPAPDEAQ